LSAAGAVLYLWLILPWSESAVSPDHKLTIRLVHPSLWTTIVGGRRIVRGEEIWAWRAADRLEVIDNYTGERVVAMKRARWDTMEDSATGLKVLWHPDGHRIVCIYEQVDFGEEPRSQCFHIRRKPLLVRRVEGGAWVLGAIPKELP
jgi:hypothetical protein